MRVRPGLFVLLAFGVAAACGRIGYPEHDPDATAPTHATGDATPGIDAAVDARAMVSEPCAEDEILCGDFEQGVGDWTLVGNVGGNTTIEIVAAPTRLGAGALRIRTDVDGDGFAAAQRTFPPVADGTLFGRVMVWVHRRTIVRDFLVLLQLDDGNDDGLQKMSLDLLPDGGMVLTATVPEPAIRPGAPPRWFPREGWVCFTFRIDIDAREGSVVVEADDRPLVSVRSIDTLPDPDGYRRLLLAAVGPDPGVSEVVFDGVSLGWRPVACPD